MLSQSHWPSGCSLHKHHRDSGLRPALLSALKLQLQKSTLLPPSCHSGLSPKVFTLEKVLKWKPTSFQGFCLSYLALFICSIFRWAFLVIKLVKNLPAMQETLVGFLGQEDLLEKGQAIHFSVLGLPYYLRR